MARLIKFESDATNKTEDTMNDNSDGIYEEVTIVMSVNILLALGDVL